MKQGKKKKKHPVIRFIAAIFIIAILGVMIKVVPIIKSGYEMYQAAISEKSIKEAVKEVKQDQDYVTLDEISENYKEAIIASEDKRFYSHPGIDFISIGRAMLVNLKEHAFVEGGSTITQQLAKNLYFSFEKRFERKVAELFVVRDLEKTLTKDEILELYCNVTYFGEGCYGIEEAADYYYGVEADDLTMEQAKALAWTIKSPNYYNPNVYTEEIA